MNGNCKGCLFRELTDEEYGHILYDYIRNINPSIKTPEEEYTRRLEICKACDYLMNGMCRLCGCFVELRAAKQSNYCATSPVKW